MLSVKDPARVLGLAFGTPSHKHHPLYLLVLQEVNMKRSDHLDGSA
jgi:hypothetical protein